MDINELKQKLKDNLDQIKPTKVLSAYLLEQPGRTIPRWTRSTDDLSTIVEEIIVLDEDTGLVARVQSSEIALSVLQPRFVRTIDGHLGAVEG